MKRKFEKLDRTFEHFLDNVLLRVSESDLTPEKRAARRKKADVDDLAFAKIYFPGIFNLPWNDAHRWIASLKSGRYTISGFRKCGKSAFTYVTKAIKPICLRIGGIVNINARTMEISDERTAALVRLMMRNKMLVYDYDIELEQKLKGFYIINNTYLIAGSFSTGLRNLVDDQFKRIRVAINDDLYNKNTVTSELDNERVFDFVESEVSGQLEDDALCITMGNSISETCPIVRLKEAHPDNHFSLPALDENGQSTWPEYRTTEEWIEFSRTIPWDVWLGEYMDRPSIKGDVFQPDWLRYININLLTVLASVSACDPSHGTSPAACDKAVLTVSLCSNHEVVVQDIWIRKESYLNMFDYVDELRYKIDKWKILLFENDFNQWDFAEPYYQDWVRKRQKTLPIFRHFARQLATEHRAADKESRILNLVHPHQTGMILYSEHIKNTADFERFKTQFLAFGRTKEKLDGLDALATAYIMVFRYLQSGGRFRTIKEKIFESTSWFRKG